MRKEEVYSFSNKIKLLLKSLEGVEIFGEQYKLNQINKLYYEVENELSKFVPTPQEEYSIRVKYLYRNMINAKREYEEIKDKGPSESANKALERYKEESIKYENAKKIRDTLKAIE